MLDYRCVAIYGWKITERKNVSKFIKEIESVDLLNVYHIMMVLIYISFMVLMKVILQQV